MRAALSRRLIGLLTATRPKSTPRCTFSSASDVERLQLTQDESLTVSRSWLRLSCQCSSCFNSATNQLRVSPEAALNSSRSMQLLHASDCGGSMRVRWDDGHESLFDLEEVRRMLADVAEARQQQQQQQQLWAGSALTLNSNSNSRHLPAPVPACDLAQGGSAGQQQLLRNLISFGFALVDGVEPTPEATVEIVRRIGPPMPTLFGEVWTFTADAERQDTAFSSEAIGPHTDTCYLQCAVGLQIFHALECAPVGGDTELVDGFHAAEQLRSLHPESFNLLCKQPVQHHYLESDTAGDSQNLLHSLQCVDRVLKTEPGNHANMQQIRYNPIDLAPLRLLHTLPQEQVRNWLTAYKQLGDLICRPGAALRMSLKPGTVLFIDNWRCLHARTAFSGRRVLTGCYVGRDEWTSLARVLGIL